MKHRAVIEFVSFALILLFVYAAVSKLTSHDKFVIELSQSPLVSQWAALVSWFIPVVELATGVLLSFHSTRIYGLYVSVFLMTLFTGYIATILWLSDHVPCSCGGILEKLGWTEHLFFNLIFLLLAILAVFFYPILVPKTQVTPQKVDVY